MKKMKGTLQKVKVFWVSLRKLFQLLRRHLRVPSIKKINYTGKVQTPVMGDRNDIEDSPRLNISSRKEDLTIT